MYTESPCLKTRLVVIGERCDPLICTYKMQLLQCYMHTPHHTEAIANYSTCSTITDSHHDATQRNSIEVTVKLHSAPNRRR